MTAKYGFFVVFANKGGCTPFGAEWRVWTTPPLAETLVYQVNERTYFHAIGDLIFESRLVLRFSRHIIHDIVDSYVFYKM